MTRKRDHRGQANRSGRPAAEWMCGADSGATDRRRTNSGPRRTRALQSDSGSTAGGAGGAGTSNRGTCCPGSPDAAMRRRNRSHEPAARRRHVRFYSLHVVWKRGTKILPNNMIARMDVLDAEVLATLQDNVCRPAVIEEAIGWRP